MDQAFSKSTGVSKNQSTEKAMMKDLKEKFRKSGQMKK